MYPPRSQLYSLFDELYSEELRCMGDVAVTVRPSADGASGTTCELSVTLRPLVHCVAVVWANAEAGASWRHLATLYVRNVLSTAAVGPRPHPSSL